MNDKQRSESDLQNFINIYLLFGPHENWSHFWKIFYTKRLFKNESPIEKFISRQCKDISYLLLMLGKENPIVKKFLAEIPLRYSKAVLSWPSPTPEEITLLMTD